ncbi:cell surface glycoprotein CD200 receptor 1-B-like isoform X2 [Chiloscyllium plagiosum]|uniref:cell surface glycoprotein CD200 receptor 1-B-like isoform X2 n=1 Tax=Chiloscyllium plagiosum TaxID=36176 RepID=UPI001CB884D9|nr:cell surface glycoprotein CD200 receptor 1-B-like isoform X2 [Chiloscyllium plagiosum]
MNFLEIGFNSKKAISVEMISVSTRLHVVLLPVAFLMAFARPGYPIAKKVSTLLGNKVLFSCPFDGNVTKMSWVFNSKLQIAALRCDLNEMALISNNSRIIIQNATCNTFKNEMNLQIESVQLADDGNYTCEILDQRGVHRLAFSFAVTVPPAISFSTDNKPNNTMMAICTASNGKPAAEITWYPNNLGNFSINITHHSNRTVTVQSKYHISIHHFSEEIICAVNHPAFDGIKNYTIHQNGPASYEIAAFPGPVRKCLSQMDLLYRWRISFMIHFNHKSQGINT